MPAGAGHTKCSGSQSGQILVLAAMAMVVLMGFLALTIDVGQFWSIRRNMQTAADAAATAGATALRFRQDAAAAAQSVTSLNGFTNGNNGVTVTVNNPPASGAYAGNSKYVEVIVAQSKSTYFMHVLGYDSVKVSARAVGSSVDSPACLYALDPASKGAISIGGNSSITLQCGAIDNSNNAAALTTGGGGSLTATAIGVVGGYSGTGFTPVPTTGIAPAADPLSYLQPPAVAACNCTNFQTNVNKSCNGNVFNKGNWTLNSGVYCGGIQINSNNSVTFNPGLYILDGGGLKWTGSGTISGSGVTFFDTQFHNGNSNKFAYAGISLSGSAQVNLSAPTSGTFEGVLFYQDPSVPSSGGASVISGSSNSTFDGAVYFPTTAVTFTGSSSSNGYTILIGDTVSVTGNGKLSANYSTLSGGSPIRSTALYE
jgi:Flp pilus assembly protein TadG